MKKMREILKTLMYNAGDTPYDIQRKAGVPRSSTYRFLTGKYTEPRGDAVRKWARLYNVTESQLRGDVPIDGIPVPSEPQELKDLLSPEEYKHLANVKNMSRDARGVMYMLSSIIASAEALVDGRDKETSNSKLRVGGKYHPSPPSKRRVKENPDATKQTGTS